MPKKGQKLSEAQKQKMRMGRIEKSKLLASTYGQFGAPYVHKPKPPGYQPQFSRGTPQADDFYKKQLASMERERLLKAAQLWEAIGRQPVRDAKGNINPRVLAFHARKPYIRQQFLYDAGKIGVTRVSPKALQMLRFLGDGATDAFLKFHAEHMGDKRSVTKREAFAFIDMILSEAKRLYPGYTQKILSRSTPDGPHEYFEYGQKFDINNPSEGYDRRRLEFERVLSGTPPSSPMYLESVPKAVPAPPTIYQPPMPNPEELMIRDIMRATLPKGKKTGGVSGGIKKKKKIPKRKEEVSYEVVYTQ
jgi:hypothetical protein